MSRSAMLLAVLFAWPMAPVRSAEVFVSPSGQDSASGGKDAPLKTVEAALARAEEGDTIILRAGAYGAFRANKQGVAIQGAAGEGITIESPARNGDPYAVIGVVAAKVTLRNLEIIGGAMHGVDFQAAGGIIEDCRVHDTGADCIKCSPSSSGVIIRRCEIYNSGKNGGWANNAEGVDNVRSDDMVLQDCYIHDIATNGAYAKGGAKDALIERCLFMRIGLSPSVQGQGVILGEVAGGTKDYESIDGTVRNCMFIDVAGAGVAAWGALRPKFYNNTCIDVAKSDRAAFIILPEHKRPSKDVTFVNNIVYGSPKGNRALVWVYNGGLEGKLTMDNNLFFGGNGKFILSGGRTLNSLKDWQQAMSVDGSSIWADPQLDKDFHLTKDSPAIGKGQLVQGLSDDYDGGKRDKDVDVGADQHDAGQALKIPPGRDAVGTGAKAEP